MGNLLVERVVNDFYNALNESRSDKLAIRFLKSKGVNDYDQQMKIIGSLKHDVPNIRNEHGKFVLGGLRCFYDHQLQDAQSISAFDKALGYIFKGGHQNDYDENLNGKSVDELTNTFSDLMKGDLEKDIERSNNRVFKGGSDYTVIPINSFDDAKKYKKYTSWCVTQKKNYYTDYVGKGSKRFYFCLKKGFESVQIPANADETAPMDEYGLSMISVLIDNMDGRSVDRITTRYNHDHNGENNSALCTAEQLENVINLPFYKTFKPYTKDELHAKGLVFFDEVQSMLDAGVPIAKIFDDINRSFHKKLYRVWLHGKFNLLYKKTNQLVLKDWMKYIYHFTNGYARVTNFNNLDNFIDIDGNFLFSNWYDILSFDINDCISIQNGDNQEIDYILIKNDKEQKNFINKNEHILFKKWYSDIQYIKNFDLFKVSANGKYNYIDKNEKQLLTKWYDDVQISNDINAYIVKNGNKYNILKEDGNYMFQEWYDRISVINKNSIYIENDNLGNYITADGKKWCKKSFEHIEVFDESRKLIKVYDQKTEKTAIVDESGDFIGNRWFTAVKKIGRHDDAYIIVYDDNHQCNLMDYNGHILYKSWYDDIYNAYKDGYFIVSKNGKMSYMSHDEKILNNKWYQECFGFVNGFAKVKIRNKYNFIDNDGNLISGIWFNIAMSFIINKNYTVVGFCREKYNMPYFCQMQENKIISEIQNNDNSMLQYNDNSMLQYYVYKFIGGECYGFNLYIMDNKGELYEFDLWLFKKQLSGNYIKFTKLGQDEIDKIRSLN